MYTHVLTYYDHLYLLDFWDDTDSKLSVPSIQADDNQDDFEFYS